MNEMKESDNEIVFESIREEYKHMASWYDCFWHSYTKATLRLPFNLVVDVLSVESTIIDVACGTGELIRLLQDKSMLDHSLKCKLIGIEQSPEMLEIARKKIESKTNHFDIDLKNSPAECLPISDLCGDCLVCTNAFHFFRDKHQALNEMKRVLKNDGKLIITDWCNNYFIVKLYHCLERLRWNWRFKDKYPGPLTRDELVDLVQAAGFESLVVSMYRVRVFLIFFWGMQTITAIKKSDDVL